MPNDEVRSAPPLPRYLLNGEAPVCAECDHTTGTFTSPLRTVARFLHIPLRVRLVKCGDTQWYEDDELSGCACRNPIHSA